MKILTEVCQNIGRRKEQQDSYITYEPKSEEALANFGTLSVVADGMGGMQAGAEASHVAVKSFLAAYLLKPETETIPEALKRSIITANADVHKLALDLGCGDDCGTTLIAAVVHRSGVYWVYAGDSRIYLTDGKILQQLTTDQIYARKLDAAFREGKIDEHIAKHHPQREALTSYLGAEEIDEIGEGCLQGNLPRKVSLLLCSDGLFKFLTDEEILEIYGKHKKESAKLLVDTVLAKSNPKQDNVTVLSMYFSGSTLNRPKMCIKEKKHIFIVLLSLLIAFIVGGVLAFLKIKVFGK